MPATSLETILSWGVYILAGGAALAILVPVALGIQRDSAISADRTQLEGLRSVLESLGPGMTVTFILPSGLQSGDVVLDGHSIVYVGTGGNVTLVSDCSFENTELSGPAAYVARADDGTVEVLPRGPG